VYYVLGTSLATGQGYRILSEPGQPADIQYPPLLPAMIAVHQKILGTSDPVDVAPWLRRTYALMFLGYALLILALARAFLPGWPALLATTLCLGQSNTYLFSDLLFTELPFSLVGAAFVLLIVNHRLSAHPRAREVALFLLAAAAFLLRTAGIALLVTWVLDAFFRRAWKRGVWRALVALVPVVAWQGYVSHVKSSDEYQHPAYAYQRAPYQFYNVTYGENLALRDPFRPELGRVNGTDLLRRFVANVAVLPEALGESVSESVGLWRAALRGSAETGSHYSWPNVAARTPLYLLAVLVVMGGVVLVRRGKWIPVTFVALSIGLICSTPWPEQLGRYFAPLFPLLTVALVLGGLEMDRILRTQSNRRVLWLGRGGMAGLFVVLLGVQAYTAALIFRQRHYEPATFVPGRGLDAPRLFYYDTAWVDWEKAVRWMQKKARRDDVVVTSAPHLLYLWTDLKAVMPPMEINPVKARELVESIPATWVIIDEFTFLDISRRYAAPAIETDPMRWRLVQKFGKTRIYQRTHGSLIDPKNSNTALAWQGGGDGASNRTWW
jgi:hypothetical protein